MMSSRQDTAFALTVSSTVEGGALYSIMDVAMVRESWLLSEGLTSVNNCRERGITFFMFQ